MSSETVPGRPPRLPAFLISSAVLGLAGLVCAALIPTGSVWDDHLASGQKLLAGVVPENPTYPIWGYSLLAGLFGERLIWIQAILAVAVAGFWFQTAMRGASDLSAGRARGRFGVAVAIAMAPWFAVTASFYSNSMSSILALAATCLLWRSVETTRWLPWTLAAGLLVGMASNIRTEFLLVAILMSLCLLAPNRAIENSTPIRRFIRAGTLLVVVFLSMLPWSIYTHATTGKFLLRSSNSGAALYLGLGVLPNNPWGVVLQDEFVDNIATQKTGVTGASPAATLAAEPYFQAAFKDAVTSEPLAFARRVVYGWRVMLLQGLYVPNLRLALGASHDDQLLLSLAVERFKQKASLSVNWYVVKEAEGRGVDLNKLRPVHYAILGAEALLRIAFVALFVGLLGALLWRLMRRRPLHFADWTAAAYLVHLVFVAGFIQTSPRHSTLVLPVFLGALLLAYVRTPQVLRASTQNRSSAG